MDVKARIYQGRNGKIYLMIGNKHTKLLLHQIEALAIDLNSIEDFDMDMYQKAYKVENA